MVAANAAMIAIATIIAKISNVIWVRRRWLQLRSLFMTTPPEAGINATAGSRFRRAYAASSDLISPSTQVIFAMVIAATCFAEQMWHAPAT
jgi:hypothetical protein